MVLPKSIRRLLIGSAAILGSLVAVACIATRTDSLIWLALKTHNTRMLVGAIELRGEGAAMPALLMALRDPDRIVRQTVVAELGQRRANQPMKVPLLIRALDDPSPYVRSQAAQSIGLLGPAAAPAVPKLIAILRGNDRAEQLGAIQALGSIGPDARESVPAIRVFEDDPDDDFRSRAVWAVEAIDAGSGSPAHPPQAATPRQG